MKATGRANAAFPVGEVASHWIDGAELEAIVIVTGVILPLLLLSLAQISATESTATSSSSSSIGAEKFGRGTHKTSSGSH